MKNRYLFIPATVVVVSLLIVGSLCDLTIAKAIFSADNGFSHFMAGFAMLPIAECLGFILGSLFKMVANHEYKKKWKNILLVLIIKEKPFQYETALLSLNINYLMLIF